MNILITAFEAFGDDSINPTERLLADIGKEQITGAKIHTLLLPVVFDECAVKLLEAVRALQPDAVICCGLASGRTSITPEQIAINLKEVPKESSVADNNGSRPYDERISLDGPDGLFSLLPVRKMVDSMREQGIPAAISYSAGTFICNNTMYALLDYIRVHQLPMVGGFVHFPASEEMAALKPSMPSLSQATMLKGLKVMIHTLLQ
ncbi:pyroglutamyl-peptidase I [Paenibacillus lutimineralis]|uniref:Pyroglutamyl-peptidase I n=1 Tax=Paenibacillus lutimineralis TaxID=2707005 RepID=A0A3Q9I9H8_9BACL|nr:pyroglutamyl-peptidase I [Paenibacillus lutimineralis]AZS15748.1 pyroglutamyl-peptidase I [Paenibacillus lutimineralis]